MGIYFLYENSMEVQGKSTRHFQFQHEDLTISSNDLQVKSINRVLRKTSKDVNSFWPLGYSG